MGNCCGQKTQRHHTEDETKGLLHSSESKTSTKAGTESGISPISDEGKGLESTKPEHEEMVVSKQPKSESETFKAQSSYSTIIAMLHTDVSSKVNHDVSLETTEVPTDAGCLDIETKTEVQEVQSIAAEVSEVPQDKVEAPAEAVASQAKAEIEDRHGSLEKQTDNTGVIATSQDSTFAPVKEAPIEKNTVKEAPVGEILVKEEPVEETPIKEAPVEEIPIKEAPIEETLVKEAPVKETLVKEAPVGEILVKEEPVEETPIKEAPVEEIPIKEAPIEETLVKEAPVEETLVKEAPVEETLVKEAPVEETLVKEAPIEETLVKGEPVEETPVREAPVEKAPVSVQVEAEFKLKPEAHVLEEKETLQLGELPLNDTTDVKHEEDGLMLHAIGDVSIIDSSTDPGSHISSQLNVVDEKSIAKVAGEECTMVSRVEKKVEEKHLEDTQQEISETSEAQEYLEQVSSPAVNITNGLAPGVENGLVKDSNSLNIKNETNTDGTVVEQLPQKDDTVHKLSGEPLNIESEEPPTKLSTYSDSTFKMDITEVKNLETKQERKEIVVEQEATQPTLNGLNSPSGSAASSPNEKSSESVAVDSTEVKGEVTALIEDKSLTSQDGAEPEPQQKEEETEKRAEKRGTQEEEKQEEEAGVAQANEEKEDTDDSETQKREFIFRSEKVEVQLISVPSEGSVEEVQNLDDRRSTDLYLGPEEAEMGASKDKPSKPVLELTIPGVERSSLAPAVDILAYSEREWKGNTAKSALIRKGYTEMSRSFSTLKQVRGDNYCALRATLYQVLVTSTQTPSWLLDEGFVLLPEMIEAREHLIGGWVFPPACTWGCEEENSVERLKYYLDLFKNKWQAVAACESPEERRSLCERVFQGGEEEYGLLEALKFLMLAKAIELHSNMLADQEVPVFCWLLFARDTSENPQTLLANHLSQIGFSGGVEQVEMFLLGYALQHTIQAFRLYMTDTDEFVTHYPDDHKQEWPCVCIVTEDDRHYNIPVRRPAQHQQNITTT